MWKMKNDVNIATLLTQPILTRIGQLNDEQYGYWKDSQER